LISAHVPPPIFHGGDYDRLVDLLNKKRSLRESTTTARQPEYTPDRSGPTAAADFRRNDAVAARDKVLSDQSFASASILKEEADL